MKHIAESISVDYVSPTKHKQEIYIEKSVLNTINFFIN